MKKFQWYINNIINPYFRPNGFYWVHQCSWIVASAYSKQVSIMQSFDYIRKYTSLIISVDASRYSSM